jgi:putative ABC transport system substrate-binding protein
VVCSATRRRSWPAGATRVWFSRIVLVLLLGALAAPRVAGAQSPLRIPRIGVIGERAATDPFLVAFRDGLQELGYIEGKSILVEYRYLQGTLTRAPALAAELVRLRVDVLVVGGTVVAQAARAATKRIPIVFVLAGDPVGSGIVASLARPGGNATGMSNLVSELGGKQLETLKAAVPRVSRVAVLYNPLNPAAEVALNEVRGAARAMTVELHVVAVRKPEDVAGAFSTLTAWRAGGVLALSDPVLGSQIPQLTSLATRHRLPAIYGRREFAEAGGLLAYGPSFLDNYRRAASYVDKILKGARPADLPVQQPTKIELIVNLKTAAALGITIPPPLLARADQVIQ